MPDNLDFLTSENAVYKANKDLWARNTICLNGGDEVLDFLRPFDWESLPGTGIGIYPGVSQIATYLREGEESRLTMLAEGNGTPGGHYRFRQMMATYLPFPDMFATVMTGHLMRQRPTPGGELDFGTLGQVGRKRNRANPTNAEIIYFNADGVGNDGSQWDNFWAGVIRNSMATGHRWIMVEAPAIRPANRRQLERLHPYLVDIDPQDVPQWYFENGQLAWIIIKVADRDITMRDGQFEDNDKAGYLLMTRAGFDRLGSQYAGGGWWKFDSEKKLQNSGTWDRTGGEIPVFPFYYQRYRGPTSTKRISKPAITEMSNAAISYMNISSASDFDAWDAAASIQFLRGVDEEGFKAAIKVLKQGSRYVPLYSNVDGEGPSSAPIAQDGSMGAVVATVFDMCLKRKLDEVARLAATQAISSPDSSGLSKHAGFMEAKVPRLALLASELEQAQNTAIYFLEKRFGSDNPSGQVVWTRKFDLVELSEDIKAYFEIESLTGLRSPTLQAAGLVKAARDKGLVADDETAEKVRNEYLEMAEQMTRTPTKKPATDPASRGLAGAENGAKGILTQ